MKLLSLKTHQWLEVNGNIIFQVTNCGEFVCDFSPPPGKQPYELIIFGRKINSDSKLKNPAENKLIASVPSSVHSHKPPLIGKHIIW